mmetsp:Transcript_60240/g.196895  ORF Transcript_60240/g.196895 Transcript_60240/m.196895 type:complete len:101 (+) Transcript_60240:1669-1971(+)
MSSLLLSPGGFGEVDKVTPTGLALVMKWHPGQRRLLLLLLLVAPTVPMLVDPRLLHRSCSSTSSSSSVSSTRYPQRLRRHRPLHLPPIPKHPQDQQLCLP